MRSYRSILAVVLAMVITLLVSCGSPTPTAQSSYTPDQIGKIQSVAASISALRATMPVLEGKIQKQDWTNVRNYIHGPFGELRRNMGYLSRELLPQDQKTAIAKSKDLFSRLQNIDMAAADGKYEVAIQNYQAAVKDFDDFLKLVPEKSAEAARG